MTGIPVSGMIAGDGADITDTGRCVPACCPTVPPDDEPQAARCLARLARARGCEVARATVYELDLPMFRTDWRLEDYPPSLAWLLEEVRKADGLIICSPTYHGTISGAIKNVLDALIFLGWDQPPYLGGKPVGIMAYGGMTSMGVLQVLTQCVRGLKGITIPTHIAVPERAIDKTTAAIVDERIDIRMDEMIDELISFSARLRVPHKAPRVRRHAGV